MPGTEADWAIVQEKALWAVDEGYAGLSIGDLVVRIGETFIGTPYAPHTLEAPGEEGLVIELEELDCVTFVENVLALARFVQTAPDELLVGAKVEFVPTLEGPELAAAVDAVEARVRAAVPIATAMYIEPDVGRGQP